MGIETQTINMMLKFQHIIGQVNLFKYAKNHCYLYTNTETQAFLDLCRFDLAVSEHQRGDRERNSGLNSCAEGSAAERAGENVKNEICR